MPPTAGGDVAVGEGVLVAVGVDVGVAVSAGAEQVIWPAVRPVGMAVPPASRVVVLWKPASGGGTSLSVVTPSPTHWYST